MYICTDALLLCRLEWECDVFCLFFFQAEDGIRDLVRSRGLGDVYKRQVLAALALGAATAEPEVSCGLGAHLENGAMSALSSTYQTFRAASHLACLLYTSDAADERSSVDLGGRRIIKKKKSGTSGTCSLRVS